MLVLIDITHMELLFDTRIYIVKRNTSSTGVAILTAHHGQCVLMPCNDLHKESHIQLKCNNILRHIEKMPQQVASTDQQDTFIDAYLYSVIL